MTDKPNNSDLEYQICQYLDGQMSGRQAARFERRLRAESDLSEQMQQYAALQSQLLEMGRDEPPDVDYDAQRADIMAALERKVLLGRLPRGRRVIRGVFGALAAAAAVAIIASVALLRLRPTEKPQPLVKVAVLPAIRAGAGSATMAVLPALSGRDRQAEVAVAWRPASEEEVDAAPPGWDVDVPDPGGQVLLGFGRSAAAEAIGYPMFIQ